MENEQQMVSNKKCECGECAQCRGFFGSKTNGILLLILIILMIIALVWMWQDKQKYFPMYKDTAGEIVENSIDEERKDEIQNIISEETIKPQSYDLSFFKKDLVDFPDSTIRQCLINNETYLVLFTIKSLQMVRV